MTSTAYSGMTAWFEFVLESIQDFLLAEPVCYVFGLVLLMFVLNFLKALIHISD